MTKFQAEIRDTTPYFRPVSDGKIVRKISKDEYEQRKAENPHDNVRAREWATAKDSGTAYEEAFDSLSGRIVQIQFRDHEQFGRSIALTLRQDDGAEGIYTVNADNQYGMSLMERLPSVDFDQPVKISAYAKQVGDKKRYTTFVTQGDDKRVDSFFKNYDVETKEWTIKEGYPEVDEKDKKKYGDKYWSQRYFPECSVFLVEYIEKNIMPKVNVAEEVVEDDVEVVPDEAF